MRVQYDGDHLLRTRSCTAVNSQSGPEGAGINSAVHSALRTARLRPQPVRGRYTILKQAAQDPRVALNDGVLLFSPHPGCYISGRNTGTDWIRALCPVHKRGYRDVVMLLPFNPHPITPSVCVFSFLRYFLYFTCAYLIICRKCSIL